MKPEKYTIDATDKPLGRLAVRIALLLRGKNKPSFRPNKEGDSFVEIKNAAKIKITGRKMKNKAYYHHSSYPGGLKKTMLGEVFKKDPGEVLRRAVWGMLPKNKLRSKQIKRLKIINSDSKDKSKK